MTKLPQDALSHILYYVDEPSDVLSIALSSKALYSVAVPQHLHYRDIRSRLGNPSLWEWLSRADDLRASQIRSLTLLPDQHDDFYHMRHSYDLRERLPPDFTPGQGIPLSASRNADACRRLETSLVSALKRMTRLQRFRWHLLPRPLLQDADNMSIWSALQSLGTVKEIDVYDGDLPSEIEASPIIFSEKFHSFKNLTALLIRTSACADDDPTVPLGLDFMLLNNLPDLQTLALELDLHEVINGTANIDNILNSANWPKLRVLRLRGVNCRVDPLIRFLTTHSSLEELTLAKMTPGRLWTRLKSGLPEYVLPKLRYLNCSSSQAAALLEHLPPHPGLETLTGFELHDKILEDTCFTWDSEWEDEDHNDETDAEIESPWKGKLLDSLRKQQSLIHVGLASLKSVKEMEDLSTVARTIKEIHISWTRAHWYITISDAQLYKLYSLFPSLEIIHEGTCMWFEPCHKIQPLEIVEKVNTQIQELARACPKLRLILVGIHAKKAIILRRDKGHENEPGTVRWVVRKWNEIEDTVVRDGEHVYGPI